MRNDFSAMPPRRRAMLESGSMLISLNGESRRLPDRLTVAELVESLGCAGKRIAVERNGEIVPRGAHAETVLADGDRLEIVVAVGGG
jgi:sulfur carrier protein